MASTLKGSLVKEREQSKNHKRLGSNEPEIELEPGEKCRVKLRRSPIANDSLLIHSSLKMLLKWTLSDQYASEPLKTLMIFNV